MLNEHLLQFNVVVEEAGRNAREAVTLKRATHGRQKKMGS